LSPASGAAGVMHRQKLRARRDAGEPAVRGDGAGDRGAVGVGAAATAPAAPQKN